MISINLIKICLLDIPSRDTYFSTEIKVREKKEKKNDFSFSRAATGGFFLSMSQLYKY
jgi:hypothetical protein